MKRIFKWIKFLKWYRQLSDKSGGGSTFVLPVRREHWFSFVVSGQFVNPALNQNQSVFRVFVLSVFLQMFPDSHSFLDQMIKIFWDLACQTFCSQNPQNLCASQVLDLKKVVFEVKSIKLFNHLKIKRRDKSTINVMIEKFASVYYVTYLTIYSINTAPITISTQKFCTVSWNRYTSSNIAIVALVISASQLRNSH